MNTLLVAVLWAVSAYAGASLIVLSAVITTICCGLDAPPFSAVARWIGWVAVGVLLLLLRP